MNRFSLFKQIDRELEKAIGIEVGTYRIEAVSDKQEDSTVSFVDVEPFGTGLLSDIQWLPDNDELAISQVIKFQHPEKLFGVEGVTLEGNILGIGMHVYSRSSMFQETLSKAEIDFYNLKNEYTLSHKFKKSTLRGTVVIETFIYTKNIRNTYPTHADIQGMKVSIGNLSELTLIVDGEGSTFPIGEFSDANGPLWKMEFGIFDATEDLFSYDNIRLLLNTSHKLFEYIKEGKTAVSRGLKAEIMLQAITLIIFKVKEECPEELFDSERADEGTILAIVKYWISTFDIDTSSLVDISNSVKTKLGSSLIGK